MNERIRELMRDSHLDVYGLGLDREKWESTVEKFALLIIDEVCDELEISKSADPYTGEVFKCERNTILDEQIDWLKWYFGDQDENTYSDKDS